MGLAKYPISSKPPATKSLFQNIGRQSDAWLFMPAHAGSKDEILAVIGTHMPPFARASSLCETYLENFSWIARIVQRDQLFSELIPAAYTRSADDKPAPGGDSHAFSGAGMAPHELALLLIVFAAGALSDLTLPAYNDEADMYYQMALAALSLSQVIGAPSLAAVQAIGLMGAYNAHSGRNSTLDLAGSFMALAANLGVSVSFRSESRVHSRTDSFPSHLDGPS